MPSGFDYCRGRPDEKWCTWHIKVKTEKTNTLSKFQPKLQVPAEEGNNWELRPTITIQGDWELIPRFFEDNEFDAQMKNISKALHGLHIAYTKESTSDPEQQMASIDIRHSKVATHRGIRRVPSLHCWPRGWPDA